MRNALTRLADLDPPPDPPSRNDLLRRLREQSRKPSAQPSPEQELQERRAQAAQAVRNAPQANISPQPGNAVSWALDRLPEGVGNARRAIQQELRPRPGPNPINALSSVLGLDEPLGLVEGPAAAAKLLPAAARSIGTRAVRSARSMRAPQNPFAGLPEPTRVYHGTPNAFEHFDPDRVAPHSLYGPGYYHTEAAEVAGGAPRGHGPDGYATTDPSGWERHARAAHEALSEELGKLRKTLAQFRREGDAEKTALFEKWVQDHETELADFTRELAENSTWAPNVRPARLGIQRPFYIDKPVSAEDAKKIIDAAENRLPGGYAETIRILRTIYHGGARSGDEIYNTLIRSGAEWVRVRKILEDVGYDGITHIGGGNTGTDPHRVWIAFDREQIRSPWGDWKNAAQFGAVGAAAVGAGAAQQRMNERK